MSFWKIGLGLKVLTRSLETVRIKKIQTYGVLPPGEECWKLRALIRFLLERHRRRSSNYGKYALNKWVLLH